jgi:hypothetical protein
MIDFLQTIGNAKLKLTLLDMGKKKEAELKEKIAHKKDPMDINKINKLQMHLGMILRNEPTLECLVQRPLAVSNATLHVFIMMKLKEVTLKFSQTPQKKH